MVVTRGHLHQYASSLQSFFRKMSFWNWQVFGVCSGSNLGLCTYKASIAKLTYICGRVKSGVLFHTFATSLSQEAY